MKKRVFVAVNLPKPVKKDLERIVKELSPQFEHDIRFLKPENWHITISFLGYQDDNNINLITKAIEETADIEAPFIELDRIVYGPLDKNPRMIWLTGTGSASALLGDIKKKLEKTISGYGVGFKQEFRKFNAHITLARFQYDKNRDLPPLDMPFNKKFEAESLDLMESHLKRSGPDYEVLVSYPFKL